MVTAARRSSTSAPTKPAASKAREQAPSRARTTHPPMKGGTDVVGTGIEPRTASGKAAKLIDTIGYQYEVPGEPGSIRAEMRVVELPVKASSAIKSEGWSNFVREAKDKGVLVVTSHKRPEAVVLAPEEYSRLRGIAEKESERKAKALAELNARFERRLASLHAPGAAEAMDRFMSEPVRLGGKVRAGQSF